MSAWSHYTHFVGIDWAKLQHEVVVLDVTGRSVAEFSFEHSAEGWKSLHEKLARFEHRVICIESGQNLIVDQLLQSSAVVYVVTGRSAAAYRTRKVPSGVKTDRVDAWSLACALRADGESWTPAHRPDDLTQELRLLTRDQVVLIGQRTMLVNQLQAALGEYYPVAIAAFDDWTSPSAWAFIERFPDPEALQKAGNRAWQKFLHLHRLARPEAFARRMSLFASAGSLPVARGAGLAKRHFALSLIKLLRCLETQLVSYAKRIKEVFHAHPDGALFSSLPGAGEKLAPRLLAEIGAERPVFPVAQALQCYAGTAPVSYQSGQISKVHVRRACNKHLRSAVHLWAKTCQSRCSWARVYYSALRQRGKSHAVALRSLGNRWLKIVWKMWQTRTPYDAELHAKNQLAHGSWVLSLTPT